MKNLPNTLTRPWSAAVALLPALGGVASPAFGATVRLPFDMAFSQTDYVLGGLLLALIVALAVTVVRDHAKEDKVIVETHSDGPDLRWWKSHPQV